MRYDELVALSPVVRREVLSGELGRRVRALPPAGGVGPGDVDAVVDTLVNMSLADVVQGIQDPGRFAEQVRDAVQTLYPPADASAPPLPQPQPPSTAATTAEEQRGVRATPSPATSHDAPGLLLLHTPTPAPASAPEHPSTPISVSASLSTPPRTSSPSGSVHPTHAHPGVGLATTTGGGGGATERERMYAAVSRLEPARRDELTDLLMSLAKRERALCLFNPEVLRAKIADAKVVLDSSGGEEEGAGEPGVCEQQQRTTTTTSSVAPSPAPSASASAPPQTTQQLSLTSLAKLPAAEIVRLLSAAPSTSPALPPLPKADPLVLKATDEFIDSLLDKPLPAQKQALGDKLSVPHFLMKHGYRAHGMW